MSAWLTGHGYDQHHRDAVLRYIGAESGFEAAVIVRSGACLGQWAGERRRAVLALGDGRCPPWEAQMAFMDAEMRSGLYTRFWRSTGGAVFPILSRTFGRGQRR